MLNQAVTGENVAAVDQIIDEEAKVIEPPVQQP